MARAVVASARERGLELPAAGEFEAIPGHGVRATIAGRQLAVGGPNLLRRGGLEPTAELAAFAGEAAGRGQGTIWLVEGEKE